MHRPLNILSDIFTHSVTTFSQEINFVPGTKLTDQQKHSFSEYLIFGDSHQVV